MQQPGPATKGNRVRQLRISCGSSPLTQPLISPAAAVQSPYLYLPGISVLAAVRRRGEGGLGGFVKAAGRRASRLADSSLSACGGWQVCFSQGAVKQAYTPAAVSTLALIFNS